jgi:hypothetical protein
LSSLQTKAAAPVNDDFLKYIAGRSGDCFPAKKARTLFITTAMTHLTSPDPLRPVMLMPMCNVINAAQRFGKRFGSSP